MVTNTWFSVKSFTIERLQKLNNDKKILVNKKYQRSKVWRDRQKADLIESITLGYPIGTLVIVERSDYFELVDGQQRLFAITDFLIDDFPNNKNKYFSKLSAEKRSEFLEYIVPALMLNAELKLDIVASIFVRLQEGTPLSTAEKVFAFVGNFRTSFMSAFYDEDNQNFFDHISKKRFRSCLVAAHFFAIELETSYAKNKFPNLDYNSLKDLNAFYKSNPIPQSAENSFNRNLAFIAKHLEDVVAKIKLRELTPLYLLVSYMRWNGTLDGSKVEPIRKLFLELDEDLNKFSIYDQEPPKDLDEKVFQALTSYKAYSRQGLTDMSLRERLNIIKAEFRRRTGKRA